MRKTHHHTKKGVFIVQCMLAMCIALSSLFLGTVSYAGSAPTFDNDLKRHLLTDPTNQNETVFNPTSFRISANQSLEENIYNLFSPHNNNSVLRNFLKIAMIGVLVLYFTRAGIDFLLNPNDEGKIKAAKNSFMYMLYGSFFVYGVTWILGTALSINTVQGSQGFLTSLFGKVLFQILAFLKAFAFFYAIVRLIWHAVEMMKALDKEDAIKSAKTGIVNVLAALVFIKVIDFIFFIAQDAGFASKAKQFMLTASRMMAYILGGIMVMALLYAGFTYINAQGDEGKVKDTKKMVTNIFYAVLIVFLFLLVARQVIAEFTG